VSDLGGGECDDFGIAGSEITGYWNS